MKSLRRLRREIERVKAETAQLRALVELEQAGIELARAQLAAVQAERQKLLNGLHGYLWPWELNKLPRAARLALCASEAARRPQEAPGSLCELYKDRPSPMAN